MQKSLLTEKCIVKYRFLGIWNIEILLLLAEKVGIWQNSHGMKIKRETFGMSQLPKAAFNETSWYINHSILCFHLQGHESRVNPMLEMCHYTIITNIIHATSRLKQYCRYGVLTAERHDGDGMQLVLWSDVRPHADNKNVPKAGNGRYNPDKHSLYDAS